MEQIPTLTPESLKNECELLIKDFFKTKKIKGDDNLPFIKNLCQIKHERTLFFVANALSQNGDYAEDALKILQSINVTPRFYCSFLYFPILNNLKNYKVGLDFTLELLNEAIENKCFDHNMLDCLLSNIGKISLKNIEEPLKNFYTMMLTNLMSYDMRKKIECLLENLENNPPDKM